ncbi:ANTAR domain-containing protein [Pseudonocardia kujensis]|uniref:ANTAR domain-containing protein n=1 Tax=Pseudonocardia kujensis TaxID=1128675 RepID=UPI001E39FAEF|nr:ANTAR domain-containing protein [Pseudonocardia kujensis]MCE0763942.1 ANTAR domain-containing protein [Pseudonocardia kujensis]
MADDAGAGGARRSGVWSLIVTAAQRRGSPTVEPADVCRACADDLGVDGVALTAVSPRGRQLLAATDARSRAAEEWHQATGRGPAVEAVEGRAVVVANGPTGPGTFADFAARAGVAEFAALPVRVGTVVVGTLTLVSGGSIGAAPDLLARAAAFADAAGAILLGGPGPGPGRDGPPGEADAGVADADQAVVLQAVGMVAVQLGVGVDEARRRLGAYADERGAPLVEVARAVVTRRLRMGSDSGP